MICRLVLLYFTKPTTRSSLMQINSTKIAHKYLTKDNINIFFYFFSSFKLIQRLNKQGIQI